MDREHVLEAGFILLAAGIALGFGALVAGRTLGRADLRRALAEAAPVPGRVPPERHQHFIATAR